MCDQNSPACSVPGITVYRSGESESIDQIPVNFEIRKEIQHLMLPVRDPDSFFKELCKSFDLLEAAGGIVANARGEILMIFRLGRWDLPKGKRDDGETIEHTALREVAEETGVKELELGEQLDITYHCYRYQGANVLKKTVWYKMHSSYTGLLVPQTEEGIEKAEWVPRNDIPERMASAYASIRTLMEQSLRLY